MLIQFTNLNVMVNCDKALPFDVPFLKDIPSIKKVVPLIYLLTRSLLMSFIWPWN